MLLELPVRGGDHKCISDILSSNPLYIMNFGQNVDTQPDTRKSYYRHIGHHHDIRRVEVNKLRACEHFASLNSKSDMKIRFACLQC